MATISAENGRDTAINCNLGENLNNSEVIKPLQRGWKVLFYVVTSMVFTSLLLKLPLFLSRQVLPSVTLPLFCPEKNASQPIARGEAYVFTMVVYSILFIGRFLESLILQIQIYKFFFYHHDKTNPKDFVRLCLKGLTQKKWIAACFIFLSMYMLAHSLSIPALGIALEILTGRKADCKPYIYEYHVVYWILDLFRYLYDVVIRLLMVLAMLAIGCIWDVEEEGTITPQNNFHLKEPKSYREYLEDRETTNKDYRARWKVYINKGKKIEYILEIFQTWFVLPWMLYFISSSLSTDQILRSWNDNFAEVSYMVYNFNQMFLLTLPYLCSKMMNIYHSTYVYDARMQQLDAQKTASRLAFAHMNKLEEEESFNFVPRIWGTSIKIEVNSSLYIILLLVGFFFTLVNALL